MASASAGISRRVNSAEPVLPEVRDAASVILLRRRAAGPQVLMGQRGTAAVFMPDMFVFPGGAVEPADLLLPGPFEVDPSTARALAVATSREIAKALPLTAIRELWEETGLLLGYPDPAAPAFAPRAPGAWRGFFAAGLRPRTAALSFVFRAITPPGRPRRFDARFFCAEAEALAGDPTGFTSADGELRGLQWIDLPAARMLPAPFITGVVLSEIEAMLADPAAPRRAPFFRHDERGSHFQLI